MKSAAELNIPTLGSRYRIIRTLGQGAFGRTYLAEDLHRFEELCVLKEFVPQVEEPTLLAKAKVLFEREAGTLHRLEHPQIPKFRELLRVSAGQDSERLFLVQDYVEGSTYRELLHNRTRYQGHFSETEVTQLLYQLLPVLEYLHSVGVVHRDISPENLILRNRDGLPVLIDFGGVKALAADLQAAFSTVTNSQATVIQDATLISSLDRALDKTRIGKVGYAPPEQLQMGVVDASSDLYGLAATMLVLATGKEPPEEQDREQEIATWAAAVPLGAPLNHVLAKMLAPAPEDRYPSATAVLAALRMDASPGIQPRSPAPENVPLRPVPSPEPILELLSSSTEIAGAVAGEDPDLETPPAVPDEPPLAPMLPPPEQEISPLSGCLQAMIGLLFVVGFAGLVFSLVMGNLPRLPLLSGGGVNRPDTTPVNPINVNGRYSAEETSRKASIESRRAELGITSAFLTSLTEQQFYRQYPELRGRTITNSPEDAPLRLRWDNTALDQLNLLEAQLSQRARRALGSYNPSDRTRWRTTINRLNVSSAALEDLADAKFAALFPNQETGQNFLTEPIGQIWYGLADDRVRDLEAQESLTPVQLAAGTYSQQLIGQLGAGEGQVFTLNLKQGQILRLNLQAGTGSTRLSIYLPTPTQAQPFLLSDAEQRTWSGPLPQSGYYEVVIVSRAAETFSYRLNIAVDNVTPQPSEIPPSPTPAAEEAVSTPQTQPVPSPTNQTGEASPEPTQPTPSPQATPTPTGGQGGLSF